jgi:succinate dehydrogenase/fumarate reductase cytochrome b subunit
MSAAHYLTTTVLEANCKMNPLIVKGFIIVLLLVIFFSLASGLYFLIHDQGKTDRIVKALTWRIGLSLLLFVLLFIAFALGWITPR